MLQLELNGMKTAGHVRYLLSFTDFGGRPTRTQAELEAARYIAHQMELLNAQEVRLEAYQAAPST